MTPKAMTAQERAEHQFKLLVSTQEERVMRMRDDLQRAEIYLLELRKRKESCVAYWTAIYTEESDYTRGFQDGWAERGTLS